MKNNPSKAESIEIAEKIPWIVIIPSVIIMSVLGTTFAAFNTDPFIFLFNLDSNGYVAYFILGPFAILSLSFIIVTINNRLASKINFKTLGYIYISTLMSLGFSAWYFPWEPIQEAMWGRLTGVSTGFVPMFWAPAAEHLTSMQIGGIPVPWSVWTVPIIFWIILAISWFFFTTSALNIFRFQWLEVEQLSYPHATIATNLLNLTERKNVTKTQLKVGLIFTAVGFLYILPYALRLFFKWFPDLYGWSSAPYSWFWNPGTLDMIRAFPGFGAAFFGPYNMNTCFIYAALAFFAPLRTQLTFWVFFLILQAVLPQILYAMGYYSGALALTSGGSRGNLLYAQPPLRLEVFGMAGVMPGIVLSSIILNWRYLYKTLKAALGKSTDLREEDESTSYRTMYLTLIGSGIVLAALFLAGGNSLIPTLWLLIFLLVSAIAMARLRGLAGPIPLGVGHQYPFLGPGLLSWYWPNVTDQNVPIDYIHTHFWASDPLGCSDGLGPVAARMGDIMSFSRGLKIKNRDVYKVTVASAIIAPIISVPLMLIICYTFGWMNLPLDTAWNTVWGYASPTVANSRAGPPPYWPWQLSGILTALFLSFMNSRFVWFPFEPVGFLLATTATSRCGHWSMFLFAWVVKTLLIRVGGSKAYTEYGIPAAVGFLAGYSIAAIVCNVAAVLRFFFPF